MRNNDLSNRTAPTILFDLDLLLEQETVKRSGIDKILSLFTAMEPSYKVNRVMRDTLIRLWNKHDVQIGLFTFDLEWEHDEKKLHSLLFQYYVPYNRLVFCVDEVDLRKERAMYLFSGDSELVSCLSDIQAKHITQLQEVLR